MFAIKPGAAGSDSAWVMGNQFREIRKADIPDALAFAKAQGLAVTEDELRHNLSLLVKAEGDIIAAALCVETEPGHHQVHLAVNSGEGSDALSQELADRALRKLQADGIGAARISGSEQQAEAALWQQTNWLERIATVTPLGMSDDAAASDDLVSAVVPSEPAQAA